MVKLDASGSLSDSHSDSTAPNSVGIRGQEILTHDPAPVEIEMADRTWNQVDARIYSDMDCSEEAVIIWAYLLAVCPNQYGVYDLPLPAMRRFFGRIISPEKINECLDELISYGCMSLFENRKVVWIKKKFKRERKASATRDQRKGALAFIGEHYPEVLNDFASLYPVIGESRGSDTPVIPQTTDSDSEADTESKKKNTSRRKAVALPALPEVEQKIHPHWRPEWETWKSIFIGQNKSGQMKETRIVRTLQHILDREKADGLTPEAMHYGFSQAIRQEATSENYVIKVAKGWKSEGYGHDPHAYVPEPPDEKAARIAKRTQRWLEEGRAKLNDWCVRNGIEPPGMDKPLREADPAFEYWELEDGRAYGSLGLGEIYKGEVING